jgi:hypothetical protein
MLVYKPAYVVKPLAVAPTVLTEPFHVNAHSRVVVPLREPVKLTIFEYV